MRVLKNGLALSGEWAIQAGQDSRCRDRTSSLKGAFTSDSEVFGLGEGMGPGAAAAAAGGSAGAGAGAGALGLAPFFPFFLSPLPSGGFGNLSIVSWR